MVEVREESESDFTNYGGSEATQIAQASAVAREPASHAGTACERVIPVSNEEALRSP